MICAIEAAKSGLDVTLIEKNERLGKKLFITGKGRCNLTNIAEKQEFFANIVSNPKFLFSAFNKFSNHDTIAYFENLGVRLAIEQGGRVFPASGKSNDIIKVLQNELKRVGVKIVYCEKIEKLETDNNKICKACTNKSVYTADKFVLALGGSSYKATGSTGDGYALAKSLGHTIVRPVAALTGIELGSAKGAKNTFRLKDLPSLEGLSLKNVLATVYSQNGKAIKSEFGEMLFTDKGVSGPIILTLSSYINRLDSNELRLAIDLKPALDYNTLDARLLRDFEKFCNKMYKNSLHELLPSKLIGFIITLSDIDAEKSVNAITKEERMQLVKLLKSLTFEIKGLADINSAVITAGGVDTREINPSTMRSKIIGNLAFAGEIIDVDALTGGYNLQIAFSTGYLAGINLADEERK